MQKLEPKEAEKRRNNAEKRDATDNGPGSGSGEKGGNDLSVFESKILSSSNQKNGGESLLNKIFFVKGFQKPCFFLGWILYSSNFGAGPGMGKSVR